MIDTPQIVQTEELRTAYIRLDIPRSDMSEAFGPAIAELMSVLGRQGVKPAGPVFAHHLKMTPDRFDFKLSVAVDEDVQPSGRVHPGTLAPRKVARTVYHGPYEGLPDAWGAFMKWVEEEGLTAEDDLWESYVVTPETTDDPNEWKTELNRPIAD